MRLELGVVGTFRDFEGFLSFLGSEYLLEEMFAKLEIFGNSEGAVEFGLLSKKVPSIFTTGI